MDGIRSVFVQLRGRCPELIPRTDKQLCLMLEAVRNVERRPTTDTKRGRPSRWPREHLLGVALNLRSILERETSGRISLQSFIGQHLRVLRFPADVQEALAAGDINRHMFWEEMKRLFFSMREVRPEDLDEQILRDFMAAVDEVSNVLYRIEVRRRKREQQPQKMKI